MPSLPKFLFFFFNDTATTEIYTLSLHDALPIWGAPRIQGELLMLGFDVSERTISRWMKRAQRNPDPAKRWITFLRNHKEAIARDGFLHRSHGHLRPALLLLYHQARRPTHSALQRHQTSHNAVDHPTVAGGISF